jgi:hypothetical protein
MNPPKPNIQNFNQSTAAKKYEKENKNRPPNTHIPSKEDSLARARKAVAFAAGDTTNREWLLSKTIIYFSKYEGKDFKWLLENAAGFTAHIIKKHKVNKTTH